MITPTHRTMVSQFGGNKAAVMIGAQYCCHSIDGNEAVDVIFKARAKRIGRSSPNVCRIIYNRGLDTYTMKMLRSPSVKAMLNGAEVKELAEYEDVYGDMLADIFESVTGLYLTL